MHVWIQLVVKVKLLSKHLQPYLVLDCEKSNMDNIFTQHCIDNLQCAAPLLHDSLHNNSRVCFCVIQHSIGYGNYRNFQTGNSVFQLMMQKMEGSTDNMSDCGM